MINESIQLHDELNPKLWKNGRLKPIVREKLLKIVDKYVSQSDVLTSDDVIDAELLGSNASFNYTESSDLDLHLVVNMEDMSCDPEIFQLACNAERSSFNRNYDITIKDIDVEMYVEDVKASTASNGIYSLYKDEWIKFPQPITVPNYEDDGEYIKLLDTWKSRAQQLLGSENEAKTIQEYINNLYNLRRTSIMKDGEFGRGNLVFKEIRNEGLLDKLKEKQYEIASKELSLESLREPKMKQRRFRVNYLLNESFHYSIIEAAEPEEAATIVQKNFDSSDDYELLAVEEDKTKMMEPGKDFGMSEIINKLIVDEWTAISGYNQASTTAQEYGLEDAARLFADLGKEELVHVGELQELMKSFDKNSDAIQEGHDEAREKLDESFEDLSKEEIAEVAAVIQKYYNKSIDEFIDDYDNDRIGRDKFVYVERFSDNNSVEIDAKDVSQGTGNLILRYFLSLKDGKIYVTAEF